MRRCAAIVNEINENGRNMNLLLITDNFPYADKEYFLEKEIPFLAEYFEEIVLVPLFYHDSRKRETECVLPGNVRVVLLDRPWTSSREIWHKLSREMFFDASRFLEALRHGNDYSFQEIRTLAASSLIHRIYARQLANTIDLSRYPLWYSYWGNGTGILFDFLRMYSPEWHSPLRVCRMHGYDLYAERWGKAFLPWQKRLLETCDLIFPCSKQGETYLARRYPGHREKIHCAHLGVSPQSVLNPGSSDGILRVLSCSSLIPVKRVNLIAESLASVRRPVEWIHIGDGPERDSLDRAANKLPDHIRFHFPGHLDNRRIMEFCETRPVDVFVNVSASEGIPVSIMEAMSFGIEPVATNVGGSAELVRPEFGTLLEPDFRTDELSNILQNFRPDAGKRQKARDFQKEGFSTGNFRTFAENMLKASASKSGTE